MSITATGVKGFLIWLRQNQPGIYQAVAPKLPALVPEAFTKINKQALGKLRAIYKSGMTRRSSQQLGDYGTYATCVLPEITVTAPAYESYPSYQSSSPVTVSYSNLSAPVCVGPICPASPTPASVDTGTDIANAANSGNAAVGTTNAIAAAVNSVAQVALSAAAYSQLANIVNSQLQNAQAGIAPKNVSTASLGIPTVKSSTTSGSDLILLILAGLAAWAVLS